MRAIWKLCGAAWIAALAGCAQTSGLAQLGLLGGSENTAQEADIQVRLAAAPDGAPPMPARNERRKEQQAKGAASDDSGAKRTVGLSLPSLSDVKLFTATAYAPDTTQWDNVPVAVYTALAQQIRACWFTPGTPKLTNHGFHADVASGEAKSATIIIYEKATDGKRGLQAFRVSIDGGSSSSTVRAENRKLDKKLDASFKSDLERWSKGNMSCQS
ncbi:MAG: hypothetical protein HC850_00745 [Rhodomicrobium sp.]|nr:hypothetical protein [Rhodomicrobium sp.]